MSMVKATIQNEEDFVEQARKVFKMINEIDPNNVHCMMGLIVSKPEPGETTNKVNGFMVGSNEDIHKMLESLARVAVSGLTEPEESPNHTNKAVH